MKTTTLVTAALLAATGSLLTTGCVYRERVVYRQQSPAPAPAAPVEEEVVVTAAPPAPIVETVTVTPGPGFVWVGGYWGWHRHRWVWVGGHWVHPPRGGVVWVAPHYVYRNGVHVYVRGCWR
jgi:hypothetical protein